MAVEQVRLLLCHTCKTTEELPDYEGPAEHDDRLEYLVSQHRFPDGNEHFGQLMKVDKKHWETPSTKRAIENRIREAAGHTGFDTEFYATKDTLAEDANTCWKQHNRNPACGDYKSEKKRLSAGTDAERKKLGLPKARSTHFLCDHCPVKSVVQQAHFKKIGMYNK